LADQHSDDGVHEAPHSEPEVADLEVLLLKVLEGRLGLVLGVPRQVHLAVLADDRAVGADEDRSVVAMLVGGELGIADIKPNSQLLRFGKQGLRLRGGYRRFEILAVHLPLVLHPPALEEGGEGELGKHHELRSHAVRFFQQVYQSPRSDGTVVCFVKRSQLRGSDLEVSAHSCSGVVHALSWAISGTSRPSGSSAGEGARSRNRPRPRSAASLPSATITSPRDSTVTGQPVSTRPL